MNLLTALDALLREKSVTAAADAVGRTQSAMSHALGRLRFQFNDPLLVRDGRAMQLTPFAQDLVEPVRSAVGAVEGVFLKRESFDPATDRRRLTIAAPDVCAPLFSSFVKRVGTEAPNLSVGFLSPSDTQAAILHGDADVGLGFTRGKTNVALEFNDLPPLDWAVFAPRDHPYAQTGKIEDWAKARHIGVGTSSVQDGPIDRAAKSHGIKRHVSAYAQNFTAGLVMAAQNEGLFTTLRKPFEPLAKTLGMAVCSMPFDMPQAISTLTLPTPYGNPFRLWARSVLRQTLELE